MAKKAAPKEATTYLAKSSVFDAYISSQRPLFSLSSRVWNPPADVFETPDEFVIKLEVAGVEAENLQVLVQGQELIMRGKRSDCDHALAEQTVHHCVELRYGLFERTYSLPMRIAPDSVSAEYKFGFLIVRAPKEKAEAKKSLSGKVAIKIS